MDCKTQLASMAIEELEKGDFVMATRILNTRIRLEPNNHEFYFERSICHHKLGNYQASLDDANEAIRLNPSDYNIHYQRGLALCGLLMLNEAITSFKKAIELRAKQSDSKLSDIFKLLKDASNETRTARERWVAINRQTHGESTSTTADNAATVAPTFGTQPEQATNQRQNVAIVNNEPVDSTTDRPSPRLGISTNHPNGAVLPTGSYVTNCGSSGNLVASTNRNSNQKQCANQISNISVVKTNALATPNTVSSSASQINDPSRRAPDYNSGAIIHKSPTLDNSKTQGSQHLVLVNDQDGRAVDDSMTQPPLTASPFEWNIRRSERIFLHNSSEPGTSGPHDDTASNHRFKPGSSPSSISSGKGQNKRLHEQAVDSKRYQNDTPPCDNKPKTSANSFVDSEIDVDDGVNIANQNRSDDINLGRRRVIVTPSSSMPATSQSSSTTANKEDSYSSKYKRLRRDRERARRGTSKLCTIKPADLDELHNLSKSNPEKSYMRVIAPIDGWLYSGQLSVDHNSQQGNGGERPHYIVKLDGDTSGSSYLFTQDTVLNDVIKEVKVKSVSELRKGARICCYWSRTYKCLSTGVVTSRTFEATKSLVSVKYDNGDLSALPLEDLRLLPPDYPKYMSNCDPLLLARNGDHTEPITTSNKQSTPSSSRIVIDCKSSNYSSCATYSRAIRNVATQDDALSERQTYPVEVLRGGDPTTSRTQSRLSNDGDNAKADNNSSSTLDDETIPPTSETINFITNESNLEMQEEQIMETESGQQPVVATNKSEASLANQIQMDNSRASSEENNYGVEYKPWVFEGPPKRSKRNGRTYRDTYSAIRRGNEVLSVGDSAELMPRDESILPFIAKIDGLWATSRGEMRVRVRWYYRLIETEGDHYELEDGENALFETDHFDENDVQSIWRTTKILSWTDYCKNHLGHVNKPSDGPKIFYLAGYYDPVRRIKHLRSDIKGLQ